MLVCRMIMKLCLTVNKCLTVAASISSTIIISKKLKTWGQISLSLLKALDVCVPHVSAHGVMHARKLPPPFCPSLNYSINFPPLNLHHLYIHLCDLDTWFILYIGRLSLMTLLRDKRKSGINPTRDFSYRRSVVGWSQSLAIEM